MMEDGTGRMELRTFEQDCGAIFEAFPSTRTDAWDNQHSFAEPMDVLVNGELAGHVFRHEVAAGEERFTAALLSQPDERCASFGSPLRYLCLPSSHGGGRLHTNTREAALYHLAVAWLHRRGRLMWTTSEIEQ
jgi:hypothetical protein